MKITFFSFFILLGLSVLYGITQYPISADEIPEYDWMTCGSALQQTSDMFGLNLTFEKMYPMCNELIINKELLIERDGERDIKIFWAHIGDTVKIELP